LAKPEWGIKRICPNCGTRYYDMRKDPPTCPSCATVFDPEALLKSRRARPAPVEEPKRAAVVAADDGEELEPADDAVAGDEEETLDEDDADEGIAAAGDEDEDGAEEKDVLIEDTSELGEDEDDVGEVVDIEDGEEEER
jgi:uncharacterized protein (TIGR02300 family)